MTRRTPSTPVEISRRVAPVLPAVGVLVGALVFGVATGAHAAEPTMAMDVWQRAFDVVDFGIGCAEQVHAAGAWLELQVGVDGPSASPLRGFGVVFLALAALVVIALGRMRLSAEHKRLELARRLVEQGHEPPPGLLSAPARNDLRRGIVLGFAGLGLVVAGLLTGDRGLCAGGLVPAFIGAGYLLSFRLAMRN
ncbi:MAG: hypothetical protein IPK74_13220 [Deltaproteobacteria bacterium]|nr:hypothetical protein [Deltaproteobacteria bacterium]